MKILVLRRLSKVVAMTWGLAFLKFGLERSLDRILDEIGTDASKGTTDSNHDENNFGIGKEH